MGEYSTWRIFSSFDTSVWQVELSRDATLVLSPCNNGIITMIMHISLGFITRLAHHPWFLDLLLTTVCFSQLSEDWLTSWLRCVAVHSRKYLRNYTRWKITPVTASVCPDHSIPPLWCIGSPPVHIYWVIHSISCVNYS